ncbi:MAG: dihydrolipoyl dehydrogenase [Bdellovibrionales bacterium]|nr:dihydrolipoyl dehydrogenase [Bdellovibrionales bacterium]NQZ18738.1 dihydrolipoyl dehydrogenase [Bdellovibrionales bacterium]
MKKYDVAIIGAGTSGLTARREVAKVTDNYVVIDDGPLGTTCARVGCMPSKVLIQAANDFHRRHSLGQQGIHGGETLTINRDQTMEHVRSLRDRFVRGVKNSLPSWENKLIRKRARFIDPHTLDLGYEKIQADKIIIAVGSRPIIPEAWSAYRDHLITTDQFFELDKLPETMAVLGLGVIGLELGQALHRLGVNIIGISRGKRMGGLSDPEVQDYAYEKLAQEMEINLEGAKIVEVNSENKLVLDVNGKKRSVDKALISIGRRSNIDRVGLENLNVTLDENGVPAHSQQNFSLNEYNHIYIAGDVTADRTILHEAADEGFIAGYSAANGNDCFKRRPLLSVTFSDPNIGVIGQSYDELKSNGVDFVSGQVSFEGQGRSIVKLKEKGILKVYADKKDGRILGSELFAPDGEHLAHLIAWGIAMKLTVTEMLTMPFYHPVVEEGLRTALRDAREKLDIESNIELIRCQDPPIR